MAVCAAAVANRDQSERTRVFAVAAPAGATTWPRGPDWGFHVAVPPNQFFDAEAFSEEAAAGGTGGGGGDGAGGL